MKTGLICLLFAGSAFTAGPPPFADRMRMAIDTYAHPPKGRGDAGYATIAARLYLREEPAWCSKRLIELLAQPPIGDMFWMFPVTAIADLDRGQLSDEARHALRRSWKTYMPYRGDTENHWGMY